MFYIIDDLVSSITINASQMHLIAKDSEIIKRMKEKIQGRCSMQHGYIIKILDEGYDIGVPSIQENGCYVQVRFKAITFKPDKDQIIDILVTQVNEDLIKGTLGHAIVMIPKSKIQDWTYRKEEGAFVNAIGEEKIQKDSKLRCRCFDYYVDMGYEMKIVATLNDKNIVGLLQ